MTFRSANSKTQIDYFIIRVNHRRMCKDYKVIPSEFSGTLHRLLVIDLRMKGFKAKMRSVGAARLK